MDPTSQTVPAPVACNNGNHHHNHGNGHNECEPVPSDDQSSSYLIKPPATMETGKVLASLLYNIQVERIKQLNGYDDCNYHLVAKGSEQEFTLKITNSLDSQNVALMQAQMDVMLYLSKQGFKVPTPVANVHNSFVHCVSIDTQNNQPNVQAQVSTTSLPLYVVRLLKYVPGVRLVDVPITQSLLIECGQYTARFTLSMANFTNPTIRNKTLSNWSLQNVPQILPYLHVIPSEERRDFIIKFVAQFEQEVLAKKDQLVHSIIHNDLNEQNILVQKQLEHGTEVAHVYGIIDFGDVEYAPVLFDLGILVAYIMLICECVDPVLVAPNLVLRGYTQTITNNARFMLSRQDIGRIFICAKARLCQSLTLGAYTHSLYPDNDYLLATAKQGWKLLQRLATVDSDDLMENWCQGLELKD